MTVSVIAERCIIYRSQMYHNPPDPKYAPRSEIQQGPKFDSLIH
jgi:hypothetical protein